MCCDVFADVVAMMLCSVMIVYQRQRFDCFGLRLKTSLIDYRYHWVRVRA